MLHSLNFFLSLLTKLRELARTLEWRLMTILLTSVKWLPWVRVPNKVVLREIVNL